MMYLRIRRSPRDGIGSSLQGRLFAFAIDSTGNAFGGGGTTLYSVNWTAGTSSVLSSSLPSDIYSIAFDGADTLYGIGNYYAPAPLVTIDVTDGTTTIIYGTKALNPFGGAFCPL